MSTKDDKSSTTRTLSHVEAHLSLVTAERVDSGEYNKYRFQSVNLFCTCCLKDYKLSYNY